MPQRHWQSWFNIGHEVPIRPRPGVDDPRGCILDGFPQTNLADMIQDDGHILGQGVRHGVGHEAYGLG